MPETDRDDQTLDTEGENEDQNQDVDAGGDQVDAQDTDATDDSAKDSKVGDGTDGADDAESFFKAVLELDPAAKDLVGKYKEPAEYIRGMHEAARTLGRRSEEAELGRLLKGKEKEFLAFLDAANAAPSPPPNAGLPTAQELELLEARILDPTTQGVRADARPEDVRRYQEAQVELRRRLYNLALHPEQALQEVLTRVGTGSAQQVSQEMADRQAAMDFARDHGRWYFADGTGQDRTPSARGAEFNQYLQLAAQKGLSTAEDQLEFARLKMIEKHGVEAINPPPSRRTAAAKHKRNAPPTDVDTEDEAALEKMPWAEYTRRRLAAGATEI